MSALSAAPIAAGSILVSVLLLGCAVCGCVASDDGPLAEAKLAGIKWSGCPLDAPVTTANLAPPHAFPGPCFGPGDPDQAAFDGALAELDWQCRTYCGQSVPVCGAAAEVLGLFCMDRDIGHRWGASCVCGP